jgi:hypothetical protein
VAGQSNRQWGEDRQQHHQADHHDADERPPILAELTPEDLPRRATDVLRGKLRAGLDLGLDEGLLDEPLFLAETGAGTRSSGCQE